MKDETDMRIEILQKIIVPESAADNGMSEVTGEACHTNSHAS
jgi:hypothetical protein